MYLTMIFLAALAYTLGGIYMKFSQGLSKLSSSILAYLCFTAGASLEAIAMHHSTLGVTYLFVIALEFILAFLFGSLFFRETYSYNSLLGVSLIIVGIVLLNAGVMQ